LLPFRHPVDAYDVDRHTIGAPVVIGRIDETRYNYQTEAVMQKLGLYQSVGIINDSEMHDLQL